MRVTVVTVSFNSGKTVGRTIESVLDQRSCDWEYIIIDGGSTDDTLSIAAGMLDKIEGVIVVSEPDEGIYDAYNKGLALASGDVIVYLNSDDFFANDHVLADIVEIFEEQGCDLVSAGTELINSKLKVIRVWHEKGVGEFPWFRQLPQPSLFIRIKVFDELDLAFDTSYLICADLKLQLEILKDGKYSVGLTEKIATKMQLGGASTRSLAAYWTSWMESRRAFNETFGSGGLAFTIYKVLTKLRQF